MNALTTTTSNGFLPATLDEAMRLADMLAKSQMVPTAYRNKPEDVFVAMAWGKEIGLAPLQALQNIAVISGKPSVYGDAAMALVQASPVCEGVEELMEGEGTPNPVAVCIAYRKGRKPVEARFSVDDAKRAGLWGKQGPWSAYPKRMLQMRARGFALRDAFPDVLKGLITQEEAQDYPEDKPRPPKDITPPRNPLDVLSAPAVPEKTTDPVVIEQVFAMEAEVEELTKREVTADPQPEVDVTDVVLPGTEVVDIPEVVQPAPVLEGGFALMVPNKAEPYSMHATLDDWQAAYEDLAEKTAKAGKRDPRERMTILRELREVNDDTINKVDTVKRLIHTANYAKRLRALGASQ